MINARLNQIYDFQYGKGNTNPDNGGIYPIYGSNGIIGGYHLYNSEDAPVIGHIGANCGAVVYGKGKHYVTYNGVICNIKEGIDSKYGYYTLLACNLKRLGYGSAQPFISYSLLNRVGIYLPNLEIQNKLGKMLYNYDQLIENNNKKIKTLETLAEEIYKEWFVRFRFPDYKNVEFVDGIPKNWKIMKLGNFGLSLTSGNRPKGGIDSSLKEGIPSFGAEVIGDLGHFDFNSVKYITHDFYSKMKKGKNTGNDILLYKDGAYIGKTTLFRDCYPFNEFCINEHVFIVQPMDLSYKNYFYFNLHQKEMFELMQLLNKNAAQPGLTKNDILRIKILIPDKDVIKKFNNQVEQILKSIFNYAKQNINLIKQRDSLLPRLMSGKLSVEGKEII